MEFVNHTPFPALAFAGVDQRAQEFHVVVLRQTLTWNDAGEMEFCEAQQPLCEADEFFGADMQGSVRQESDLCPYKPRCDVIVNATAYPPQRGDGVAPERFNIGLRVSRPGMPAPVPPQPQGLNPLMPAPPEEMRAWRMEVERAKRTIVPGQRLIDKTLSVTGKRGFVKHAGLLRIVAALVRVGTLGIVRLPTWRLTSSQATSAVPVNLEYAFGGQCRIESSSKAADSVPKKYRLTPEQAASHPDAPQTPIAHDAYAANPFGMGFVRDWYLAATGASSVPAPQIENPECPITLSHFNRCRAGKLDADESLAVGLGVRPKGHPERAKLVGTIDREFIESDSPLPKDFDFAVWNAAWPDQQVDALRGDEQIELFNLCTRSTPGAIHDSKGNVTLKLALPGHLPFVLVRFENGSIGELESRLDTVLIDPDLRQVSCIWRATLPKQPDVRVLESRMIERANIEPVVHGSVTAQPEGAKHG